MSFEHIATRYLLPILLVALTVAGYFTFGTVETIELDSPSVVRPHESPLRSPETSRLAVGERFASLEELDRDQQAASFVRVGRFGETWPARVVEVRSERGGISFVRSNGTAHTYSEFDGYTLKMVRLAQGAEETIAVYRSLQHSY